MKPKERKYLERLVREVDPGRIFAASGLIIHNRMVKQGLIGPDDGISPTDDDVHQFLTGCDMRQLKLLRKIASGLVVTAEPLH